MLHLKLQLMLQAPEGRDDALRSVSLGEDLWHILTVDMSLPRLLMLEIYAEFFFILMGAVLLTLVAAAEGASLDSTLFGEKLLLSFTTVRISTDSVYGWEEKTPSTKPEIVILDTGLATELTPAHQASLAEFFQAIINWDGANVAKNIIAFSSNLQPSFDSAVFTKDVTTAVRHFQDSTPRAGDCMAAIFETVQRHHVTIDPNVMVAVVTVMVLEGWQFRLDPSINILDYIGAVMRSSFRKHQRLTVMDFGLRDMWAPFSEPNALTMDRSGARPMAWSMQGSGENSGGLWYGEYQSRD